MGYLMNKWMHLYGMGAFVTRKYIKIVCDALFDDKVIL
jgi:hypothetical protein